MIFNSCPADKKVLSVYQLIIYNDLFAKDFIFVANKITDL